MMLDFQEWCEIKRGSSNPIFFYDRAGIADEAFIEKSVGRLDAPSSLVLALNHKDEGNKAFKERHYVQASVYYLQAIDALTGPGATKADAESDECLAACFSNRAACQLKLGHHESALEDADKLLALQPEHVKGLFRKGLARLADEALRVEVQQHMRRFAEALQVVQLGSTLKSQTA